MKINNLTNKSIITENAIEAISLKQKILGLIFYKKPAAMIFRTGFGIHTFFMKYPIDVIILNNKNKVVKIKKSLKPNRIFIWNPIYSTVIELSVEGENSSTPFRVGDFLEFL